MADNGEVVSIAADLLAAVSGGAGAGERGPLEVLSQTATATSRPAPARIEQIL